MTQRFLLDTCVVSELRKPRPQGDVVALLNLQPNSRNPLSGGSGAKFASRFCCMALMASRTLALLQIAPCSQPMWRRLSSVLRLRPAFGWICLTGQ